MPRETMIYPKQLAKRLARSTGAALIATVLGAAAASPPGHAISIAPEKCDGMRGIRNALESLGVRDDMAQGVQSASQNLSVERLTRIKTYIVTSEDILFRCRSWPRHIDEGMDDVANMPDPKPRYERNVFPLPVRKPRRAAGLRLQTQ